jgi:SWI/SNF-related matrix-associated actin-dependent regulator 1 of chromatin subfamily A
MSDAPVHATIRVDKIGSRYIARVSFDQRAIPKAAEFRWDPKDKVWYTTDAAVAAKLEDADAITEVLAQAAAKEEAKAASIQASRSASVDIELPCPDGVSYLPYQRAGISFGLDRESVLFGDEMGLGKTIQAIGMINSDPSLKKILVICPATLRLNWRKEMQRWLVIPRSIVIAEGSSCPCEAFDITIINYDILKKNREKLDRVEWDIIITDEAHYLKNPNAQRTIAVVGQEKKGEIIKPGIKARRKVMLTGTPIPNRPIEGWPLFHYLAPQEFRSFWGYAKRYCDAQQNGYGWDMTGAANLGELQDKLRSTIMVRRLKADVLTELPAKRRAVIELPQNGSASVVAAEQKGWSAYQDMVEDLRARVELAKASDKPEDYEDAVSKLRQAVQSAFTEMAKLRHATAVAKIPYVIAHINDSIEGGKKIIVFAHHKDVVHALEAEFGECCVSVTGDTPMVRRQDNVDRFQSDPNCLIFIGNIQAAGVGLTLTASSHVIFAELDWVPGNVTQAEDRAHRIGQKEMVLVQHLVLEGSLDAKMARTIVEKQAVIDQALDKETIEIPVTPVEPRERGASELSTRDKIGEEASKMTPSRIAAVHSGLRILAGLDQDFASAKNDMGFSKIDVRIGHDLAERWELTPRQSALGAKLVNKYRRQLPPEIVAVAKGECE